jgi:2-polyprenyl-3-methyl-5-hydroxy-6-metoxy-1,4-benzoquinol methylase
MAGPDAANLDADALKAYSFSVWSYKQGELVSMMIHLGDRLGIYKAMQGRGAMTAAELAEQTGYHPRWLLEWLRNQAAARLLDFENPDRFTLSDEGAEVLANEDESLHFAGGAFRPWPAGLIDGLAEAFTTGIGLTYQDQGPDGAHGVERTLGPWTRQMLVPRIIPALEGVHDKLTAGATVADVGCGGGVALATLARAYPNSAFHGFDPTSHAIDLGNRKVTDDNLGNLEFHLARGEEIPADMFDFVLTFDCLHDMTRPDIVIARIRQSLLPGGTWLIKDIKSHADFKANMRNPMLAMMYGFSVTSCMSSAMSEPDGLGLGTLGFNPEVAERMVREAGFSHFQMHDFEDPANLYYEVRR